MKNRQLMVSVSVVFWGWHTGIIYLSMIIAFTLMGSLFVRTRLDLSQSDFNRISDSCTVILMVIAA